MTISTKFLLALLVATAGAAQAKDGAMYADSLNLVEEAVDQWNDTKSR
jgi:hypothetical protein